MGFRCGIVGLPNVGKSTIFNAITASEQAAAANYPFCTIEPNMGMVPVPDPRIDRLVELVKPAKVQPAMMQFVDIAGLVEGASENAGRGNKFLSHIRDVDTIAHVVRCFDDGEIVHVLGSVDPLRDIEIIESELGIKDVEMLDARLQRVEKLAKGGDKEALRQFNVLKRVRDHIDKGGQARDLTHDENDRPIIDEMRLLTAKPVLFVANVAEKDLPKGNEYSERVKKWAADHGAECILISGKIESEIALLPNADRASFLEGLGLTHSGLDNLIRAGYKLLGLRTYLTAGPKEVRAWTIHAGDTGPKAAGKIHSDFERGFIAAECISFKDYDELGGEQEAKAAGRMRIEGKEYVVQDGDVIVFRFNV